MPRSTGPGARFRTVLGYLLGMAVEAAVVGLLMLIGLAVAWLSQRP